MAIEIMEDPQIHVNAGITYHIYATEQTAEATSEQQTPVQGQELAQQVAPCARVIGAVAIAPSQMARYADNEPNPYIIHDIMQVQGLVGGKAVYDKTISPRGFLGIHKPFYGLRINIAKRRAAHRVKSVLTA